MAGEGPGVRRHIHLHFGVDLEHMRNAIATSSERPYQGHFVACVDVRVRCIMPVSLVRCGDSMTNAWHLFEYVAYVFVTTKLLSATIESHLSAIKCFHRISRGSELDTVHLGLDDALTGTPMRMRTLVSKQPSAGLFRGEC